MSRPAILLLAAVVLSPALAYGIYRAAKALGFLDPAVDRQHELRRQILAALYAFLIFLPVFLFGWERRWPRLWILFGATSGFALVFFLVSGIASARTLWRLRHPPTLAVGPPPAAARAEASEGPPDLDL